MENHSKEAKIDTDLLFKKGLEASDWFLGSVYEILIPYRYSDPGIRLAFEKLGELYIKVKDCIQDGTIKWEDYQKAGNSYRLMCFEKEKGYSSYQKTKEEYENALANIKGSQRELMRQFCEEGLCGVRNKHDEYYI